MSTATEDVFSLGAKITSLQSAIKLLKKSGAPAQQLAEENAKLQDLRGQLAEMEKNAAPTAVFARKSFDELILRKMYVVPSFEIHNGPAGLFDYGPPACALKANVLALWRQHFALEENMLEMECTNLTPSNVLETSGHVERFTDFMTKDEKTGECFRADKLLEDGIDAFLVANPKLSEDEQEVHRINQRQADAFSAEDLFGMLKKYNVKSPSNPENELTMPFPFNLMFKTTIGPEGTAVGFLRPETAQGLFVNFRRLLDYNQQKMPFAAAQIGLGFRNEIAPRNGLLRVREFCMAEIEHFVNPTDKTHPKFKKVADKELVLFPSDAQLGTGRTVRMTVGEAVEQGVINNETLGYFMARTQLWLERIGVDPKRMRFRQHLKTEMAHYAADCWDMEIHLCYGWIECVGHADRACYDLEQHSKKAGVPMVAAVRLPEPIQVDRIIAEPNKKLIGPRYKLEQKTVINALEALEGAELDAFQTALTTDGKAMVAGFEITPELVSFKSEKKTIVETKYTPSVIEPSYGIGRILYSVLEHAFSQRSGDENRCVMSFKPCVAPIKVGIYRLTNHGPFDVIVARLRETLQAANIVNKVDSSSGTVGKRYARSDELGIPFGVTIDFQTLLDDTVTLRERDSMAQIRIPLSRLQQILQQLVDESICWDTIMSRFPVVRAGGEGDDDDDEVDGKVPKKEDEVSTAPIIVETTLRGMFSRPNPLATAK